MRPRFAPISSSARTRTRPRTRPRARRDRKAYRSRPASYGTAREETMNLGMQAPQSIVAHQIIDLHVIVLGICILIGLVVFGIMFYSIARHRRSIGHQASQFDGNKRLEIV